MRRHKCSGDIQKLLRNNRSVSGSPSQPAGDLGAGLPQDSGAEEEHSESRSSPPPPHHPHPAQLKKYEYMCAKCGCNFYTEDELQNHIDRCILEPDESSAAAATRAATSAELNNRPTDDEDDDNNRTADEKQAAENQNETEASWDEKKESGNIQTEVTQEDRETPSDGVVGAGAVGSGTKRSTTRTARAATAATTAGLWRLVSLLTHSHCLCFCCVTLDTLVLVTMSTRIPG